MGCTRCGPDTMMMDLVVNKAINEALDTGKLQAGLNSCAGERLRQDDKVVMCSELGDSVCTLIEDGSLCIPKPALLSATRDTEDSSIVNITLTMSDGTPYTTKFKTGVSKEEIGKVVSEAIKPFEQKIKALQAKLDAIPEHVAGIELVDGTGAISLAHAHETEEM